MTWRSVARPAGGALGIVLAATLATALLLGPMSPADAAEVARPPAPNAACQSEYSTGLDIHRSIDGNGNELSKTDPDGYVTSYAYTSQGLRCGMLSPDGYASPNNDTLTSCPSGSAPYVTAYGYDAEGDLTSTTLYDGTGNTVSNTYVTSDMYNAAGELCVTLTADGYATGARLSGSCPTSATNYERIYDGYDVFGNLIEKIAPLNAGGGITSHTYDADGNQLTLTNPAGDVTTSAYNADDELCWTYEGSSSNACGSPPSGSSSGATSYSYDATGNTVAQVSPDGNATGADSCLYETTSAFDNLGDTLSTSTPTGGTNCTNVTDSTTSTTYDPDGHVLTTTSGTNVTTTNTYDADGELCWSYVGSSSDDCGTVPSGSTSYTYCEDACAAVEPLSWV